MVTGNFKHETIAQRSRAFEQYLTHVYSIEELRWSKELADFFYGADLAVAYTSIRKGQFMDALVLLEISVQLQVRLLGEMHSDVIATLCAIVVCYNQMEQYESAQAYAETALKCIPKDCLERHLVSLLHLSIRLCWKLGKDKQDLEERLNALQVQGAEIETYPTLMELVVRRFT